MNGGPAVCNFTVPHQCVGSAPGVPWWDISPFLPSGTYVHGELNDPKIRTDYWSIEIGIPIKEYIRYNKYSSYPPRPGSYWRIDFSRVEWHITIHETSTGLVYWKDTSKPEENWVWQATYNNPPNMHLPETWGYIQFADGPVNSTPLQKDPQWPVRDALMKVYYALTKYYSTHLQYTTDLSVLVSEEGLPEYVAQGTCTSVPVIVLGNPTGFTVTSTLHNMVGHVKNDRYLWFESKPSLLELLVMNN